MLGFLVEFPIIFQDDCIVEIFLLIDKNHTNGFQQFQQDVVVRIDLVQIFQLVSFLSHILGKSIHLSTNLLRQCHSLVHMCTQSILIRPSETLLTSKEGAPVDPH